MTAILSTGTELTRGELGNSNSQWLAAELAEINAPVTAILAVDDHAGRIAAALRQLASNHEVVVCTGGLGPTTDDLTATALADAAGVTLEIHEPSLESIRKRLERLGRTLTEANAKQAQVPSGSTVLPNHWGTAPGFVFRLNRAEIYCLPGVPSEMKAMFQAFVKPRLLETSRKSCTQIILRTYGMPESTVNDALAGIESMYTVHLGYRVHFPELAVKVVAIRDNADQSMSDARKAARAAAEILGSQVVFGEDDVTLPGVLAQRLRERQQRIGLAESCTGGCASALLTGQAGVSDVFMGSIVAYSNDVKERALGVPRELIEQHGAVSREVALAMAEGAVRALGCDWGLSFTGVAGPTGGTQEKPVGTVYFAVVGPGLSRCHHRVFRGERSYVQRAAAFAGINWVRCLTLDHNAEPQ